MQLHFLTNRHSVPLSASEYPLAEETIVLTFDSLGPAIGEKAFTYQHISAMETELVDSDTVAVVSSTAAAADPDEDPEYESSVEQALRELDIAIGDNSLAEGDSDEEDESANGEAINPISDEDDDDDEEHLENVLRQLFIDNMLSSLSSPEAEVAEGQTQDGAVEGEAEAAEQRVEPPKSAEVVAHEPSKPDDRNGPLERAVSEDHFFDDLPDICQSTPSTRHKRRPLAQEGSRPQPAFLFTDLDLSSSANVESDGTVTGGHGDGEAEETFVVAKSSAVVGHVVPTVSVCQGDAVAEETFVVEVTAVEPQSQNKFLKDSNVTMTPVNTPIEVNYDYRESGGGGEGDMTFTKDLDACAYLDEAAASSHGGGGGWYLHPQEVEEASPARDETFDYESFPPPPPPDDDYYCGAGDLGYDVDYGRDDTDDDNDAEYERGRANMDFDALRKQLVDLLPHAQGAPALDDEGAAGG